MLVDPLHPSGADLRFRKRETVGSRTLSVARDGKWPVITSPIALVSTKNMVEIEAILAVRYIRNQSSFRYVH